MKTAGRFGWWCWWLRVELDRFERRPGAERVASGESSSAVGEEDGDDRASEEREERNDEGGDGAGSEDGERTVVDPCDAVLRRCGATAGRLQREGESANEQGTGVDKGSARTLPV